MGIVGLSAQSRSDVLLCRGCFRDQEAQGFRGVIEKASAERPLTVNKAPDGPFIYPEAPRGSGGPAKHLDAMGEVLAQILHCG